MTKEAVKYTLVGQQLYRRGFAFPLLKCLDQEEAKYTMKEVHEGVCRTHIGGRALASKIARADYYWPMLKSDCMSFVKRCDKWTQGTPRKVARNPLAVAVLQIGGGHLRAISLSTRADYFTKWIKAEPVAVISVERVKKFLWKKIICRFGLLAIIVSNNRTQFASKTTAEFCQGLGIKQIFTSVEHPQTNGQAGAANKVILKGLRRRLEEAKGRWAEELPQVLWSYHTTPHSVTNETLFRLTFGTEAVIPIEIGEPSLRTALFEPNTNEGELRANLDMLQEVREATHIREFAIKSRVAKLFRPQDLVLRKMVHKAENNKLTPKWEGPFRVRKEAGRGAYRLETLKGKEIPRTWNAASLRMYYS
ncbi:Tf2-11, partial [Mucuna pruriens]